MRLAVYIYFVAFLSSTLSFHQSRMQLRKLAVKGMKVPMRSSSTAAMNTNLIQKVSELQKEKAGRIVPWFTSNMPVCNINNIFLMI